MATITERIDTRRLSLDANGQSAGTRSFSILGVQNAAGALVAFNDLAGSKIFPDNPALVFDRVDIEGRNGNSLYIATASYSTFKGGRRQQDPTDAPPVPFFGWAYGKETVKIPLAYQVDITTRAGDEELTKRVWTATTQDITERRIKRTLKVSFRAANTAQLDIIADQDRKVHKIRGIQYLFLGADVSQSATDQTEFVITYSWELDRGTFITPTESTLVAFPGFPLPDPGTGARKMYIVAPDSATQTNSGSIRLRRPYSVLDLVASDEPTQLPRAVEFMPYEIDDDGWRGLPGMVPL